MLSLSISLLRDYAAIAHISTLHVMSLFAQVYAARWLLFSALLAFYAADKYRKYTRLRAFRGPFSTGWSEIWHAGVMLNKCSHLAYKDVNDEYGE